MRQVLKWLGIGLGILVGVLVVAVASAVLRGNSKLDQRYTIEPEAVNIPADATSIERGQYLAAVSCAGCHGDDLGGAPFFQDPAMGSIPAPNLTTGVGGAASTYSDADFVRSIRHGVGPDGKALAIMPAQAFWHYSDEDLGAIIAWLRNAPPVANDPGERSINFLPIWVSSRFKAVETEGWARRSFCAASVTDRDSASTTKVRSRFQSSSRTSRSAGREGAIASIIVQTYNRNSDYLFD